MASLKVRWYVRHYWLSIVPLMIMVAMIVTGWPWVNWIIMPLWILIIAMYERGQRWSYRTGYMIGVIHFTEALNRSGSAEEFARLVDQIPEPWERR